MQFARLNHTVIHYQLIGAPAGKPVIVFANSLGTDFRIWRDVIVRLAGDYAIITYDKRGHGLERARRRARYNRNPCRRSRRPARSSPGEIGCHLRPVHRRTDRPGALCRAAGPDPRADPLRHRAQDRHRRDVERAHPIRREARASAVSPTVSWRTGSRRNFIGSAAPNSPAIARCLCASRSKVTPPPAPRSAMPTSRPSPSASISRPWSSSATRMARHRRRWCNPSQS